MICTVALCLLLADPVPKQQCSYDWVSGLLTCKYVLKDGSTYSFRSY